VSVYFALLLTFVLIPALMLALDGANLAYHRAKAQNLAEAAALAAVKDTAHVPIPIPNPKKMIYFVPYDGWILNTLHLRNVEWSIGLPGKGKLRVADELMKYNGDKAFGVAKPSLQPLETWPIGNVVSPIMLVRAPVTVDVKLMTPLLSRVMNGRAEVSANNKQTVTVRAEACGMAWFRPDYVWHGWWDPETLDTVLGLGDKPLKYYRLVNCVENPWDFAKLAEPVITEWLILKYDKGNAADMQKAQAELQDTLKHVEDWLKDRKPEAEKKIGPSESEVRQMEEDKGRGQPTGRDRTLGDCTDPVRCGEEADQEYTQEKKRFEEEQERQREEREQRSTP
jgi:hypothetical protein